MFFQWVKNVDHALQSSLRDVGFLPQKCEFRPTLRRHRNNPDGSEILNVKITSSTLRNCRVYYSGNDSMSLQQAISENLVGKRYTKAVAILALRYVWGISMQNTFGK